MTEQRPMATTDAPQPQQGADVAHKVKVGDREMTLTEARATMHPALAHQIEQQFPRAHETPGLAQQMVEAYAAAHEREHGQPWTGQHQDQAKAEPAVHESDKSRTAHAERTQQREHGSKRHG